MIKDIRKNLKRTAQKTLINNNQEDIPLRIKISRRIWANYNPKVDSKKGFFDMKRRIYLETNEFRKLHNIPILTINRNLAYEAQKQANYLAQINRMAHDRRNNVNKWGENLAMGSLSVAHFGVRRWYNEIKNYNFDNPKYKKGIGHFTQLVWKNTKQVGCGVAFNGKIVYTVCKYYPPGNYIGQFRQNVPRPMYE